MLIKYLAAAVAVMLVVAYLVPVVLKLKEVSLGIVIAVGIAMMLVDLWHSLQSQED